MNLIDTPDIFLTKTNHEYPPGNNLLFEQYFLERFIKETPNVNRIYLPIQWTSFYISRNYANSDMNDLQNFLNSLPKENKYFTIVQWDDGIINNLNGLDIIKFSSGGVGDYPIPLINLPHLKTNRERNIFASFVGVINGRHVIREKIQKCVLNNENYVIKEKVGFNQFKEIMESSIFSLCPRGYGKTSFRINESLNLGSIPVYIYDESWIPFYDIIDFESYGVLISENEIPNLDKKLKSYTKKDIEKMQIKGQEVYKEYYTYESCYKQIIKILNKNE